MATISKNQPALNEGADGRLKGIYILGGVTTVIYIMGIILDIVVGTTLGGDLTALPKTAIDRFSQLQNNWLLGLYNLDLLNIILQIILIPSFFAIYAVHRNVSEGYAALAMFLFLVGTAVFVTNNTALAMLELSNAYAAATTESQKMLLSAAGEGLLARGAHGSPGVFIGFALPTVANLMISFVMFQGNIFNKATSYMGILGCTWMLAYLTLVTFVPGIKNIAMIIAMPGGIISMAWMIMFAIRLFRLGRP